jgi:hypothetical protein
LVKKQYPVGNKCKITDNQTDTIVIKIKKKELKIMSGANNPNPHCTSRLGRNLSPTACPAFFAGNTIDNKY